MSWRAVPRRVTRADGESIVGVYLSSFRATYDFPLAHSDTEIRGWIAEHVISSLETWVVEAQGERGSEGSRAFTALTDAQGERLYVDSAWTGEGIGSQLIELAKERRPQGLVLWAFQVNDGARRFHERHGFTAVEFTHGSGLEDGEPDARCTWEP